MARLLQGLSTLQKMTFVHLLCVCSQQAPRCHKHPKVPWAPEPMFTSPHPFSHLRKNLIKNILKTVWNFCIIDKYSSCPSHWAIWENTLSLTFFYNKGCLIICLIYKPVYLNLIKRFLNKKRIKIVRCFNNHFIGEKEKKKKTVTQKLLLWLKKNVKKKKNRLVVLEELRKSLGV